MALTTNRFRLNFSTRVERPTSADDKAPKWNLLVPLGPHYRDDLPGGKMVVTPDAVDTMKANWERANKPPVRGDYFHYGGTDVPNVPLESKMASGWAVDMKTDTHGLWVLIDWTDKARGHILSGELAGLSPEIYFNPVDRNNGGRQGWTLTSFGLLNDPSFQNLPRVAAAEPHEAPLPEKEEPIMEKKLLCAQLGLAETATDTEIQAALKAQATALAEAKEQISKLTASADEKTKLAAESAKKEKATTEETIKLAARVDALEKEKADTAVASLCSKLEKEGRILASDKTMVAELVTNMGLEKATKFAATFPVKVKLGEVGHGGDDVDAASIVDAKAKFMAKVDELQKAEPTLKVSAAYERVKSADPELAKLAFQKN